MDVQQVWVIKDRDGNVQVSEARVLSVRVKKMRARVDSWRKVSESQSAK